MVIFLFVAYDLGKETSKLTIELRWKQPEIHFELQHTRQRCETGEGKKWAWTIEDNLITYKPENKQEVAYYAFIYCEFSKPVTREHIFLGIVFRVLYYNFV